MSILEYFTKAKSSTKESNTVFPHIEISRVSSTEYTNIVGATEMATVKKQRVTYKEGGIK